jgi:hypothetical protein
VTKQTTIRADSDRWQAGAEATARSRKTKKTVAIVLERHRATGAKAGNAAQKSHQKRERREDGSSPYHAALAPFSRSAGAIADLCGVFGYPPAVIPQLAPARVHRIKTPADNHSPDIRPQNQPRAARPKHSDIYRMRHGVQERLCRSCGQWLPLTIDNFRWRQDRVTGSWNGECRLCDNLRRRETAARRAAGG